MIIPRNFSGFAFHEVSFLWIKGETVPLQQSIPYAELP